MIRYSYRSLHKADDFAGRIDVTTTETLVEVDGGLRVDSHAVGIHEGNRVDDRDSRFAPNVTMAAACAYRDSHGYTRVS